MPGGSIALAALTLLGASGARYEVGATAQASYGTEWEALAPAKGTLLELVPRLALSYLERGFEFRLAYDPQILMAVSSPPPTVLHRATTSFGLRAARGTDLTAVANASYGIKNYWVQFVSPGPRPESGTAPDAGGGTEPQPPGSTTGPGTTPTETTIQPLPAVSKVTYFETGGRLGLQVRDSPRLMLNASLSYLAQGGADAPSRVAVPIQRGPGASVGIGWRPAPDHKLTTSILGSYYTFVSEPPTVFAPNAWTSQLLEAWEYSLTSHNRLRLGVGVSTSGTATDFPRLALSHLAPVAEGSLELGRGLRLAARYGSFLDFTNGKSAQRAEAYANLGIPLGRAWSLAANASGAQVVTGPQRGQLTASAQLVASNRPVRALGLFAGLTGLWQRSGSYYLVATVRQASLVIGVAFDEGGRF